MKQIKRILTKILFPARIFNILCINEFAKNIKRKNILELGSGTKSVKEYFDKSNRFTQSDIYPIMGYDIVDATTMESKNEFDIIICMNVLEHIFDYKKAIDNIYSALKYNGSVFITVPYFYPIHAEPTDYFRISEHGWRLLLKDFEDVNIIHFGIRQIPLGYCITAKKKKTNTDFREYR